MRSMRMPRSVRMPRALVALFLLFGTAPEAPAQTKTQTELFGWNLQGEIESGIQGLPQNPNGTHTPGLADGKFEEYRDIRGLGNDNNSGLFLENLHLRLFRPDEAYSIEMSGKDWGFHTQEFHLLGERLGQWQVGFDWDQMRHVYSTDSQTLLKAFGDNVFIVRGSPGGRPPIPAWTTGRTGAAVPRPYPSAARTATARSASSGSRGGCSSSSRRRPISTSRAS